MRIKKRVFYTGDVNAEYGGLFYTLADFAHGYANAVRIQPCSDAGAADNCYWVEQLSVHFPSDPAELASAFDCCGIDPAELNEAQRMLATVEACVSYGHYEIDSSECVQIGARQSDSGEPIHADTILRAHADIGRYARKMIKAE